MPKLESTLHFEERAKERFDLNKQELNQILTTASDFTKYILAGFHDGKEIRTLKFKGEEIDIIVARGKTAVTIYKSIHEPDNQLKNTFKSIRAEYSELYKNKNFLDRKIESIIKDLKEYNNKSLFYRLFNKFEVV